MNKNDFILIFILLSVSLVILFIFNVTKKEGNIAKVYYENNVVLTIDLNIDNIYYVEGDNGQIEIEVKDKKIRVKEENSPLHLCSKQGYISKSYETIVCLPNKIVIKIEDDIKLDGVVG